MVCLQKQRRDERTCIGAVWAVLLQHRRVALIHVFEHSVQRGVEKSLRAAAL